MEREPDATPNRDAIDDLRRIQEEHEMLMRRLAEHHAGGVADYAASAIRANAKRGKI